MKTTTYQYAKTTERSAFQTDYLSALTQYISNGYEAALGRGYESGRKAMAEGKSLMDFSSVHHQALQEILASARSDQATQHALEAGGHFLAETLSPYERVHRGFNVAVSARRQMNQRLEQQIKSIPYSVHDEAGQLLAAVNLALATLTLELPA